MRRIRYIAFLLALALTLPVGGVYLPEGAYTSVRSKEKLLCLTFDDGPHYKYTDRILDILDKYNIKATFFVIGCNAEKHPEQVKRIYESGHEIGNHTYCHPHLSECSCERLENEIKKASDIIYDITGQRPTLFRPPEGCCSEKVMSCAEKSGCNVILWSIDTRDWTHPSSDNIVSGICKDVRGGDIILFHDFITPTSPTPDALEVLIPMLLDKGYSFCRVSELIAS